MTLLLCMQNHRYPESGDVYESYEAGKVYDVEGALAWRFIAEFGPTEGRRDPKSPEPVKFMYAADAGMTAEDVETPAPEDAEPETEPCGAPVGNGSCILETGHAGAHRLYPEE